MKKIYLACAAALLSSFTFAQSDKERNQLTLTTQQKKEILAGVDPAKVMRSHSRGSCDTLVTELTGGNSYNGNMFDMNALNLLTLETFSVTVDGTVNIAIYYRNGTYVGSTTTSAGWIFLDSAVVTGAGLGVPVQVPVSLGLTLTPSTTYGFYVSATDPAATFHYTDGTAVGTLHASDANLQFFEGHGGEWPFNLNNQPRVFNGNVIYCLGGVGISEQNNQLQFDAYPNPANQTISFNLAAFNGMPVDFTIYDAFGNSAYSASVTGGGTQTFDISAYANGVYMVEALTGQERITSRFLIAR